ncbi:MAG: multidrug efflux RND transporter permease subunit [Vampirovibrionales bacterium]|nr:multidrug efflux RND transporter permease subunit [Vampirovibrionales bacterium]
MISEFFIQRPIFASVSAIVVLLMGLIAIPFLPVNQYPDIAPPKVQISAIFPGANAETVEAAVTNPLEQEVNGVQGMRYIQSTSTNDGLSLVSVTFDHGTDLNEAVMDVKNRVDMALGRLPVEVKATGVKVEKSSDTIILGIGFFSPDGSRSQQFISNFVDRVVLDRLKRIEGVGSIQLFGERKYAMRLWLDPVKLAARRLSVQDVVGAIQSQNQEVPAGQIGQAPLEHGQQYQLPILVKGRLADVNAFNNVVVGHGPSGAVIRLGDVGRAELGAEDYSKITRWQGYNSVGFGVNQLPEANALQVAQAVRAELKAMVKELPDGVMYEVAFDPTTFIDDSIHEVVKTLLEAIVCVVIVIFLFLQNWRTTLIPSITIPVSLVGTFFFMKVFGFSINLLTMFGLILATGIVVDDAIVVIENIVRLMETKGLSAKEAAVEGMREVFGAVIATALVLIAVFVPVAFFPGTTGLLYQQFALTIAFSVAISAFNAITLTPALSAQMLTHADAENRTGFWAKFFNQVNKIIDGANNGYKRALSLVMAHQRWVMIGFLALLAVTGLYFNALPKGFVPSEDQGYFIIAAQGPEGVSLDYMTNVTRQVEAIMKPEKGVNGVFAINGFGFTGNAPNTALMFVPLKPMTERLSTHGNGMADIIQRVRGKLLSIPDAIVIPFEPPAVRGLGNMGGFQFQLQDKAGTAPLSDLAKYQFALMGGSQKEKSLTGVFATFTTDSPLLKVTVDRERAVSLGVAMDEVFRTLQVLMGSMYVNDFTYNNRSYKVIAQADSQYRDKPELLNSLYIRNAAMTMIPITTVMTATEDTGAQIISHFNLSRSTEINGSPAPGASSGEAMDAMKKLAKNILPKGFGYEWSGLYLEQSESAGQSVLFLGLGLIFVFLVLAAQYESYLDPLIIILSVPLAALGALLALQLRGMDNNVFCQVGLVLLVGLASKNAILIVEFANQLREQGRSIMEAAYESAVIRFRPIVMTSLAFIIGVLPLVFAHGAGAAARQALGTTVFGGMVLSTGLSLLLVPVLYVLLKTLEESWVRSHPAKPKED